MPKEQHDIHINLEDEVLSIFDQKRKRAINSFFLDDPEELMRKPKNLNIKQHKEETKKGPNSISKASLKVKI